MTGWGEKAVNGAMADCGQELPLLCAEVQVIQAFQDDRHFGQERLQPLAADVAADLPDEGQRLDEIDRVDTLPLSGLLRLPGDPGSWLALPCLSCLLASKASAWCP
jgi:hypothetical protein